MPILDFLGKSDVVQYHKRVSVRLLHEEAQFSCTSAGVSSDNDSSENLIVEGDNLEALRALLPRYGGQVKCIYIDPPYNTGNEGWAYNDNVNAPAIKQWLSKAVGRDDLSRHDKWLCMMLPRLKLLREFLRPDGAIFISIDDNEVHHLRCLLDEVFGEQNFVAQIEWQKRYTRSNNTDNFTSVVEHILLYGKTDLFRPNLLERSDEANDRYSNPDNDPRGAWKAIPFLNQVAPEKRPNLAYEITNPNTGEKIYSDKKAWRSEKAVFEKLLAEDRIWWGKDGRSKSPTVKRFLTEVKQGITPINLWDYQFAGHTDIANAEIKDIFGDKIFDTPKPSTLIKRILQIASDPDSIILDSFAGSGTTAQAVLELNKQDGGRRRFVLVEMETAIARGITAERVRRVAAGYTDAKGRQVEGTGGGFRFMRLGETLFDENGEISPSVRFGELAQYVFFHETGVPFQEAATQANTTLLGIVDGKAIVLLYNGILKDKTAQGGNALTRETQGIIRASIEAVFADFAGRIVVYGTSCRLSEERLRETGIVFKQIPYHLHLDNE